MGMAPVAHVVFNKFMTFNPKNPKWVNRDRFVLSYVLFCTFCTNNGSHDGHIKQAGIAQRNSGAIQLRSCASLPWPQTRECHFCFFGLSRSSIATFFFHLTPYRTRPNN